MNIKRKYRLLVRLSSGDYLLPANDGRRLWRVYRYHEDGSAERRDARGGWRPLRGSFWATALYRHPFAFDDELPFDFEDREAHWISFIHQTLATRAEAIAAALGSD